MMVAIWGEAMNHLKESEMCQDPLEIVSFIIDQDIKIRYV